MRILLFATLLMLITACNNSSEKKGDTTDTAKQVVQMPETPATPDTLFHAFGTEPFWSEYVINNNKIEYHTAEGMDVEVPFVAATTPDNLTTNYASNNGKDTINLTLVKKDCSDGMSEETHPYQVTMKVDGAQYHGCAKKGN